MAPSYSLCAFFRWCLLVALLCVSTPCCMSGKVYSRCDESYRLGAQGAINVPHEATDAYCSGPCLAETNLVLNCIDSILYNFRFYNGASLHDVRYALRRGCGHGGKRGDFDVLGRTEGGNYGGEFLGDYGEDYDYGSGNMPAVTFTVLLVLSSCVMLLWAF